MRRDPHAGRRYIPFYHSGCVIGGSKMAANDTSAAVFVVDDDASVRDGIRTLLRSVGLQAEVFSSAEEFLKAARPESPSCLVLDVRLPGVNGLDLQDQLNNAGIEMPIIFITAHGEA